MFGNNCSHVDQERYVCFCFVEIKILKSADSNFYPPKEKIIMSEHCFCLTISAPSDPGPLSPLPPLQTGKTTISVQRAAVATFYLSKLW